MGAELLAPAGSLESLRAALYFGADAVYCGGPFLQLRAESAGFGFPELEEAVRLAHGQGKKLYVTVNCFAKNEEIPRVGEYAKRLLEIGADAVIAADPGVIAEIAEACPAMPIHVSTQANTLNYKSVEVYRRLGASRVVLGREMTLAEIEALAGKTQGVELEVFVHGAMCMAYSGRCLLSSFLNRRSGNRGECSQPCRWNYYLVEEKRKNTCIPIREADGATAILSSVDLNALPLLDRLIAAGVCSFKIEGRMKSPYYVGTVVNAYRQYLDGKAPIGLCETELNSVSHRPYGTGFYLGEAQSDPNNDGLYHSRCTFIAKTVAAAENGGYVVEMRNRFSEGDTLEIVSPRSMGLSFPVTRIVGADGTPKSTADLVQEHVTIECPYPLCPGDLLRRENAGSEKE